MDNWTHQGTVIYYNSPRLNFLGDDGKQRSVVYKPNTFPIEWNRLGGHQCQIHPNAAILFQEVNGIIKDICFRDIPTFDLNQYDESLIVRLLADGAAFSNRNGCLNCNMFVSRDAINGGKYLKPLTIGIVLRHNYAIHNGLIRTANATLIENSKKEKESGNKN